MEQNSNRVSLLLEANLRFLSASLQQNAIILNTLNNPNALDENQTILNNLLNWLKSLNQIGGLSQGEKVLIEALIESVRKAKSFEINFDKNSSVSLVGDKNLQQDFEFEKSAISNVSEIPSTNVEESNENRDNGIKPESEDEEQLNPPETEQQETDLSFFYRMNEENDRWEYLTSIKNFISSYEHLMHLLIPNLASEVVIELHRYDCKNKLIINEAISYPSVLFQNMITKFLREAPGSNLFRRIRRIKLDNDIDITFEQAVNIGERKNIKLFVGNYFNTLTKFLDPEDGTGIERYAELVKTSFRNFSLGPASVEMRLTAVIKHISESAFNDAEQAIHNDNASIKTKLIYLATTQLICDFQNFLLNEPRLVKFLEDLKR